VAGPPGRGAEGTARRQRPAPGAPQRIGSGPGCRPRAAVPLAYPRSARGGTPACQSFPFGVLRAHAQRQAGSDGAARQKHALEDVRKVLTGSGRHIVDLGPAGSLAMGGGGLSRLLGRRFEAVHGKRPWRALLGTGR
jgi:hypothetical protein